MLGLILLLPWPFFTFALQAAAAAIGQGRAIGIGSFFGLGRDHWHAAYLWAGVNLAALALLAANARFYGSGASPLGDTLAASLLSSLLLTLMGLWGTWQVFSLAAHPHLSTPGWRAAWKASSEIVLAHPAPALLAVLLAAALAILGAAVPPIGLLFSFSSIAILTNRTVMEIRGTAHRTA